VSTSEHQNYGENYDLRRAHSLLTILAKNLANRQYMGFRRGRIFACPIFRWLHCRSQNILTLPRECV